MRVSNFLILIYAFLLFSSCKIRERIIEKTEYLVDSTEVVYLKNEVVSLKKQVVQYDEKLKESKRENERIQSNASLTVREFDTDKPNAPLKKETQYNQSKSAERSLQSDVELITSLKNENSSLKIENSELSKKVEFWEKELKDAKSIKSVSTVFQWWWLVIGFAVGILVCVLYNWVKNKLKLLSIK